MKAVFERSVQCLLPSCKRLPIAKTDSVDLRQVNATFHSSTKALNQYGLLTLQNSVDRLSAAFYQANNFLIRANLK